MHLHPVLAALRSDDAPQRQAQTALFGATAAWRMAEAEAMSALAAFGAGEELGDCPRLAELFSDSAHAMAFAAGFVGDMAQALVLAPLGHLPLRHFTDGTVSTLLLARSGRAALFLAAIDGEGLSTQRPPVSVSFAGTESHEAILAGSARAELVSADRERTELTLAPGSMLSRDCSRRALVLREVSGTLVSLRLQRRGDDPPPTREIDLATGRLVHQAAARAEESRAELMIALLGRMGRSDAAPALTRIALERGPQALRWQALRECLGLDTAAGFAVLDQIARSPTDPLAPPAGALRAQLIEAHPQLAEIVLCPA